MAPPIWIRVRDLPLKAFGDWYGGRTRKQVLSALASRADPDGGNCYPGIDTLTKECGLSPRSIYRVLSDLEKRCGLIRIDTKASINRTNLYTFLLSDPDSTDTVTEVAQCQSCQPDPARCGTNTLPDVALYQPITNHRPMRIAKKRRARAQKPSAAECVAIYNAYPKHKDKDRALPAIAKALEKTPYPELLARVERYAQKVQKDGTDMQYVKYPATWFNAGAYKDDDLKPPPEYDVVEVSGEEWWGKTDGAH